MKLAFLGLILMSFVALEVVFATPIQIVQVHRDADADSIVALKDTVVGSSRQQPITTGLATAPAAVAVAEEEDDDDDDDDDDIEDALVDDDDDDDDDEEETASDDDDDDEDDYLERFFDDILGADDDDDDDDDISPSTGLVQQPIQQIVSAPSAPSAVDDAATSAIGGSAVDYPLTEGDSVIYDDDIGADADGVSVIDTSPGDAVKEPSDNQLAQTVIQPISSIGATGTGAAAAAADEDDDEEDEEDDIESALDDDDDDDDEEDDDEEDDDDDLIGDDVIEARHSRLSKHLHGKRQQRQQQSGSIKNRQLKGAAADDGTLVTPVPDILINKYNRFVDGIFDRINGILKRSYDPVSVRLAASGDNKSKTTSKKRKSSKRKSNTIGQKRTQPAEEPTEKAVKTMEAQQRVKREAVAVEVLEKFVATAENEVAAAQPPQQRTTNNETTNKHHKTTKSKTKAAPSKKSQPQRARGVLYGLSTLKRQGNVRVMAMADHTTVKSNFRLGPLMLNVEKAFGRGAKRELKSATATTTEMLGRINLRIVNGAATLHSIKVQQPKQVKVDSADNHDRTREFVWRKSSHIAQVVSEKLTSAARSMLQPPPSRSSKSSRKSKMAPAFLH